MSLFWTIWISVITLGTIIGCYLLVRWTLGNHTGVPEGESMGHSFDGIEEINNQLPRWWTILFYVCIVWGFVYLALFPGLGAFKGLLDWKSSNQGVLSLEESAQARVDAKAQGLIVEYDRELDNAAQEYDPIFRKYAEIPVEELAMNQEALKIGQRLFLQNCSQCHGSDARGANVGFPNLTDDDWLYGGSGAKIKETLTLGRRPLMPAQLNTLGEQGIKETVAYVLSLSNREQSEEMTALIPAGESHFKTICAMCHGPDGKGNQMMGAPNLSDDIWLYGSTERSLTETLTYGRNGVMPSFKKTLGDDKIHVVAAYVYSLSNN